MNRPDRTRALNIAIGAVLSVLLILTLAPSSSNTIDFRSLCLICGVRGLADAILNVVLFVPLGLVLGARIKSNLRAYALAVAISTGIECAQVFIPGRDSSVADIVYNGLGAIAGVGLTRSWRLWLTPRPAAMRRLGMLATLGAVAVLATTDFLMRPAFPATQYDVAWTPRLRHLAYYEGSVLEASIGGVVTPDGLLEDSDRVRSKLLTGEPLQVLVVSGAPPNGQAPILTVNGFQMEIVSLSLDGFDLGFRYRMRADALRLDSPELWQRGAMSSIRPGKTLRLQVERQDKAICLSVDASQRCGLGFRLGDGWSLLLWSASLPAWLPALLGLAWLAALSLPVGFWAGQPRQAVVGASVIGIALFAIPMIGYLLATPWPHYLAALGGVGLGRLLRARIPSPGP